MSAALTAAPVGAAPAPAPPLPPPAPGSRLIASAHKTSTGVLVDAECEVLSAHARRYILSTVHHSFGPLGLFDLVLLSCAALVLHLRHPAAPGAPVAGDDPAVRSADGGSAVGAVIATVRASPTALAAAALALLVLVRVALKSAHVASEELLVIEGVGLQLTARNALGRVVARRFIDCHAVRALFIHEGYFRHQALFFLAAVVDDASEAVVIFEHLLPRLEVLRAVLRGARAVLFREPEHGPSLADIAAAAAAAA